MAAFMRKAPSVFFFFIDFVFYSYCLFSAKKDLFCGILICYAIAIGTFCYIFYSHCVDVPLLNSLIIWEKQNEYFLSGA